MGKLICNIWTKITIRCLWYVSLFLQYNMMCQQCVEILWLLITRHMTYSKLKGTLYIVANMYVMYRAMCSFIWISLIKMFLTFIHSDVLYCHYCDYCLNCSCKDTPTPKKHLTCPWHSVEVFVMYMPYLFPCIIIFPE